MNSLGITFHIYIWDSFPERRFVTRLPSLGRNWLIFLLDKISLNKCENYTQPSNLFPTPSNPLSQNHFISSSSLLSHSLTARSRKNPRIDSVTHQLHRSNGDGSYDGWFSKRWTAERVDGSGRVHQWWQLQRGSREAEDFFFFLVEVYSLW